MDSYTYEITINGSHKESRRIDIPMITARPVDEVIEIIYILDSLAML